MYPFVVGDIGGTHARFALVCEGVGAPDDIAEQQIYDCADFNSLEDVLATYLDSLAGGQPRGACLAVAGPIVGDHIRFTNLPWAFSVSSLKSGLEFEALYCINDFAALAFAVPGFSTRDLMPLQTGAVVEDAPRLVIGPGTGLGIAALVPTGGGWSVVAGEGGHASFAPVGRLQQQLREVMAPDSAYLCDEQLLSGRGLVALYGALAFLEDREPQPYSARQISALAADEADPLCRRALLLFLEILGGVAGDNCLRFGAWGGVYLGGGILPQLDRALKSSNFLSCFSNKGVQRELLERIPISLITADNPALAGASRWYLRQTAIEAY